MPLSSTILMIRPAAFGFNEETAANNYFQSNPGLSPEEVQRKAVAEFDNMVQTLRNHDINVLVIEDSKEPPKPDAIFPNNWLSTSPDGIVSVFPMYATNRRIEKRDEILEAIAKEFVVKDVQDWSEYEAEGRFLEGTGSMVIDYENKMIYACVSERTSLPVLEKYAGTNNFQAIVFLATDKNGRPVYHTNVMMCVGTDLTVVCLESIRDIRVREEFLRLLGKRDIVDISLEQMGSFAGNMLELQPFGERKPLLVMSASAKKSLRQEQLRMIESHCDIASPDLRIIEANGGGSARCMLAEIFYEEF